MIFLRAKLLSENETREVFVPAHFDSVAIRDPENCIVLGMRLRIHEIGIERRLPRKVQPYVQAIKDLRGHCLDGNGRVLVGKKDDEEAGKCSHKYGRESNLYKNFEMAKTKE